MRKSNKNEDDQVERLGAIFDAENLKTGILRLQKFKQKQETKIEKKQYEDLSSNHSLHGHVGCETLKHYQLQSDLSFTRA